MASRRRRSKRWAGDRWSRPGAVDRGRARMRRRSAPTRSSRSSSARRISTRAASRSCPRRRSSACDEKPADAFRTKEDSSLVRAVKAVADGEADAVVSAGNTGAMLAAGLVLLRRVPGVRRPAIAVPIPARKGPSVLIDAGANADCRAEHLLQFATMGAVFAEEILDIARPRCGFSRSARSRRRGTSSPSRRTSCSPRPTSTSAATPRAATSSRAPPTSSSPTASRATSRSRRSRGRSAPCSTRCARRSPPARPEPSAGCSSVPPPGGCASASTPTPTEAPTSSACAGSS